MQLSSMKMKIPFLNEKQCERMELVVACRERNRFAEEECLLFLVYLKTRKIVETAARTATVKWSLSRAPHNC